MFPFVDYVRKYIALRLIFTYQPCEQISVNSQGISLSH